MSARAHHQERLPRELLFAGITDMEEANRYLKNVYLPAFNAEFMQPATEEGSAFVPWIAGDLNDILCERFGKRTVGNDNCVSFAGMKLQIPADRYRYHYVKAKVSVLRRINGNLAILNWLRNLAEYDSTGQLLKPEIKTVA